MSKRSLQIGTMALVAAASLLGACQSQLLSDDRIASNTAGVLGMSPGNLVVSDRTSTATNTFYTVTTKDGKQYHCTINGGGALAMGLTNAPACNEKK